MRCDGEFNPERFTRPEYVEEQTLVDRKRDIPKIRSKNLDAKAEFIRDVIAIANASRRRGQPGYLLFGIDNEWNITGIEGQTVRPELPADYNPDDPRSVEHLQREIIESAFQKIADKYIAPSSPVLNYYHGFVEDKRVSYLEICAEYQHKSPYEVKKGIIAPKRSLNVGQCWVRRGDSKGEPLSEEEKRFLYAWTDVPYIDYRSWRAYLENLSNLTGASAETISGYQDLQTRQGNSLQDEFVQFIEAPSQSLLVIVGQAGSGKTVFVKDRIREAARNLLAELELTGERISPLEFQNYIPVFFSLRNVSIGIGESFAPKLLRQMDSASLLGFNTAETPEKIFNHAGYKWLVVLDGFDEANFARKNRANLWGAIDEFARQYQNRVKVVLTTRPDIELPSLPVYGRQIVVAPLTLDQVVNFLEAQIRPALMEQFEDFLQFVNSEPELWGHLRVPLFLGTTARYFSGGEITEEASEDTYDFWEENSYINFQATVKEPRDEEFAYDVDELKETIIQPVKQALEDEGDFPDEDSKEDKNNDGNEEEVEEPWLMGKLLAFVFDRLWEHNRKKLMTGVDCGDRNETFCDLGKMAVHTCDRKWLSKDTVQTFLNGRIACLLDLGILIRNRARIKFPTLLSKAYFGAFYLDVTLQTSADEISSLIKNHLTFWERCLRLLKEITVEDTTSIEQQLNTLSRKESV